MNNKKISSVKLERATIDDVAQMVGVSISTVSRVINESGYYSEKTAKKVHRAIEKLNFKPQSSARGLASRRTNTLGLVVNNLKGSYLGPLLRGIDQKTRELGYNLLITTQPPADEIYHVLGDHNTDGLTIVADPGISNDVLLGYVQTKFPVVLMFRIPPEGISLPYVVAENVTSSYKLIKHLILKHNCRRIGYLRGPETEQDSSRREIGYRTALEEHGIEICPDLISYGGFDKETAEAAAKKWFTDGIRPDAIFTGDDESAVGVYKAIEDAGLKIPEDIAVVGFDDDYVATRLNPSLTTVHVPLDELGRKAVESLNQFIKTGQTTSNTITTKVVIRQSCGCKAS